MNLSMESRNPDLNSPSQNEPHEYSIFLNKNLSPLHYAYFESQSLSKLNSIPATCTDAIAELTNLETKLMQLQLSQNFEQQSKTDQQNLFAVRDNYLKARLVDEINSNLRILAPKYYGHEMMRWKNDSDVSVEELRWRLSVVEAHRVRLEDPEVSRDAFEHLVQDLVVNDFRGVTDSLVRAEGSKNSWNMIRNQSEIRRKSWRREALNLSRRPASSRSRRIAFASSDPNLNLSNDHLFDERQISKDDDDDQTRRLEADLAEKETKLRIEMNNKFRARPVPVTSIIPRYEELMRSKSNKSTRVRAERMKTLQSQVQPFQLSQSRHAGDDAKSIRACKCSTKLASTVENALSNLRKEREKHLAHQTTQKGPENEKKKYLTEEHKFQPAINHHVPDFENIHREFENKMSETKIKYSPTKQMPFPGIELHHQSSINAESTKPEQKDKTHVTPWIPSGSHSSTKTESHPPTIKQKATPTKTHAKLLIKETISHQLKSEKVRESIQLLSKAEEVEKQRRLEKRIRKKELSIKIQSKIQYDNTQKQKERSLQRKKFKEEQRQRQLEYEKSLKEMNERLDDRKCLFEQEELKNAQQSGEKAMNVSFLKQSGVNLSAVSIFTFPVTGRGLKAEKPLKKGDPILRIPPNLLWSVENAFKHQKLGPVLKKYTLIDDDILAIFLLYIKAHGKNSNSAPDRGRYNHIVAFPETYTSSYYFTDEELTYCAGTEVHVLTPRVREQIREDFAKLYQIVFSADPNMFPPNVFNVEQYAWAIFSVYSRCMDFQITPTKNVRVLVPFVDMFNHSPDVETCHMMDGKGHIVVTASQNYAAGDEVFISYGKFSNSKMLRLYGFVIWPTIHNSVSLVIGTPEIAEFYTQKVSLFNKCGLPVEFTAELNLADPLPNKVLQYLRIQRLDATEVVKAIAENSTLAEKISDENEREVLESLQAAVRHSIAMFTYSESEYVELIDHGLEKYSNKWMAAVVGLGELQIWKKTLEKIETLISVL
ncbi:hypothetical protein HK098_006652 [Nowakowskiella sp. JEL0407]|nr:hypothetical protein HK098_006652 [Nowakowskiella sp. JEL0407]